MYTKKCLGAFVFASAVLTTLITPRSALAVCVFQGKDPVTKMDSYHCEGGDAAPGQGTGGVCPPASYYGCDVFVSAPSDAPSPSPIGSSIPVNHGGPPADTGSGVPPDWGAGPWAGGANNGGAGGGPKVVTCS